MIKFSKITAFIQLNNQTWKNWTIEWDNDG